MGFDFKGYGGVWEKEPGFYGAHILIFDLRNDIKEVDEAKLKKICEQDDDSQPMSVYQIYFGTLWIMMPYCG